jgi:hypothetical protein
MHAESLRNIQSNKSATVSEDQKIIISIVDELNKVVDQLREYI